MGGGLAPKDVERLELWQKELEGEIGQVATHCGATLKVDVDEAAFLANGFNHGDATDGCGKIVRAMAHVCKAGGSASKATAYETLSCAYEARPDVGYEVEGTGVTVRFGKNTTNLYSDSYAWFERASPGTPSTEQ